MATTQELREKVHSLKTQMRDLVKRAEDEKREMSADELDQFEQMSKDQDKADRELNARMLIISQKEKEYQESGESSRGTEEKKPYKDRYREAWEGFMTRGKDSLPVEQKQYLAKGITTRGTDPLSSTTGNLGGYTVPETYSTELIEKMKWYGGMLQVSHILTTNSGETMYFPGIDDTSNTARLLTEGSQMNVKDTSFFQRQLDSYMYVTDIIKLPIQLIQDNIVNLQSELNRIVPEQLGRAFNTATTTADGSSKPQGVVGATSKGADAAAAATISRTDLLNLQHSVDRAYRFNGRYMFSDSTLLALKLLSIGSADDRPLWVPSMRDGSPSTIEGFPYTINDDMADVAGDAKSVLFGDFSKFYIRLVNGMSVVRFDEKYMDYLQIGFAFYQRMDSELIDTNAIKHLLHPTT